MAVNFPDSPSVNDTFTSGTRTYKYDGTSWRLFSSGTSINPIAASIIPSADETYDLGSSTKKFRDLYLSGNTLHLGTTQLSVDNDGALQTSVGGQTVAIGGGGTTVYATLAELPLSGVDAGTQAYVTENNRLYLHNGTGWYNIALINTAPSITSGGAGSYVLAADGTPTVITLTATDPEEIPITWSYAVTSGSLGSIATVTQDGNEFTITPSTNAADVGEFTITFTASDGVNIATDVNSFILAFVSPLWDDTLLSIGTNSTNGLDNSTFVDRSTNGHTVTTSGSPVQTVFHPYLDNWSVYFPGTSGALYTADNADFAYGTGDLTVEVWFYPTAAPSNQVFLDQRESSPSGGGYSIECGSNLIPYLATNVAVLSGTIAMNLNEWNHIVYTRSGTDLSLFVNGSRSATATNSTNFTSQRVTIGGYTNRSSSLAYGYISDVRLVKGYSEYDPTSTTITVPTEKLTAVVGTSLLTCQSNRFIDNSTNNHTLTVSGTGTGTQKISAFNPFGQDSEYTPGQNKGSMYADGDDSGISADVSSTNILDLGSSAFTIEAWLYLDEDQAYGTGNSNTRWFSYENHSSTGAIGILLEGSTNAVWPESIRVDCNGNSSDLVTSNSIMPFEWGHHALVRSGNTLRYYLNGVVIGENTNFTTTFGTATNKGIEVMTAKGLNGYDARGYIADFKIKVGTATYTSEFTPPTSPVGGSDADIYVTFDNAGIFDKTGNNTLQLYGDASTSTTETKYTTTSIGLDGSGDYVFLPNSSPALQSLPQGSSWTIDFWGYITTTGSHLLGINRESTGTNAYLILGTSVLLDAYSSSNTIPLNQWVHHAMVYDASNGNLTYYRDGTQIYQRTGVTTLTYPLSDCVIGFGAEFDAASGGGPGNYTNGYMEDINIVAAAKYTANFTPPVRTQGRIYQQSS